MMITVLGGLVFYFRQQNRYWLSHLDAPDPNILRHLHELARGRGWMLCYLWGMLTLVIIIYDLRYPTQAEEAMPDIPATIGSRAPITPSAAQVSEVTRDIEIDKIKTYFEDAYVSYYYLHKCRVARPEDNAILYRALLSALEAYQASAEAPQIMSAAKGSFEVIYSQTACEAGKLDPVRARFDNFIHSLSHPGTASDTAQ